MAAFGAKALQEVGAVGNGGAGSYQDLGYVTQQEHPHDREQQGAGNHEEAGVAEGELEANAQTRGSIHGLLPLARCPADVSMRYPAPATVAMIQGSPRRLRSAETVMRTALVNGSAF